METSAHGVGVKRFLAVIVLVCMAFVAGRLTARPAWKPPEPVDYTTLTPAELSWVREGIMERISELEDEMKRVTDIQNLKSGCNFG